MYNIRQIITCTDEVDTHKFGHRYIKMKRIYYLAELLCYRHDIVLESRHSMGSLFISSSFLSKIAFSLPAAHYIYILF